MNILKDRRTFLTAGGAIGVAGGLAVFWNQTPPEIRSQLSELAVALVGAAIFFLRSKIQKLGK